MYTMKDPIPFFAYYMNVAECTVWCGGGAKDEAIKP